MSQNYMNEMRNEYKSELNTEKTDFGVPKYTCSKTEERQENYRMGTKSK